MTRVFELNGWVDRFGLSLIWIGMPFRSVAGTGTGLGIETISDASGLTVFAVWLFVIGLFCWGVMRQCRSKSSPSTVLLHQTPVDSEWSRADAELPQLIQQVQTSVSVLEARAREMMDLAYTDPLTGLLNRRGLTDRFERSSRRGCLLFIDIDRFKEINDRYGHAVGDHALCSVARLLSRSTRQFCPGRCHATDQISRWAGDAFVLFLEDDSLTIEAAAGRLRMSLHQAHRFQEVPSPVYLSVGHVVVSDDRALLDWVAQADRSMFQVKAEAASARYGGGLVQRIQC